MASSSSSAAALAQPVSGEQEVAAATKIQAAHRAKRTRKDVSEMKQQKAAATKIQSVQRGKQARKEFAEQKGAATKIQSVQRGKQARKELAAKRAKTPNTPAAENLVRTPSRPSIRIPRTNASTNSLTSESTGSQDSAREGLNTADRARTRQERDEKKKLELGTARQRWEDDEKHAKDVVRNILDISKHPASEGNVENDVDVVKRLKERWFSDSSTVDDVLIFPPYIFSSVQSAIEASGVRTRLVDLFHMADSNNDRVLDHFDDFLFLTELIPGITVNEMHYAHMMMDTDGNGSVHFNEFRESIKLSADAEHAVVTRDQSKPAKVVEQALTHLVEKLDSAGTRGYEASCRCINQYEMYMLLRRITKKSELDMSEMRVVLALALSLSEGEDISQQFHSVALRSGASVRALLYSVLDYNNKFEQRRKLQAQEMAQFGEESKMHRNAQRGIAPKSLAQTSSAGPGPGSYDTGSGPSGPAFTMSASAEKSKRAIESPVKSPEVEVPPRPAPRPRRIVNDSSQYKASHYRTAAEAGDAHALFGLAHCYEHGLGVSADAAKASKYYKNSADKGYAPAQHALGNLYVHGQGVAMDVATAVTYYEPAARLGYAPSIHALGDTFSKGNGVDRNHAEGERLKKLARDHGYDVAMDYVPLSSTRGVAPECTSYIPQADDFRAAAEAGDDHAEYGLGYCYEHGLGVERDLIKALKSYKNSADMGYAPAQHALGQLVTSMAVTDGSFEKDVLNFYKLAAAKGYAPAMHALGELYAQGTGVKRDPAEGWRLQAQASKLGYCANVAYGPFSATKGVARVKQRNLVKAVDFRSAAGAGDVHAQYELGYCYENGLGTVADASQAVIWYEKAAKQKYPPAQHSLGNMYASGRGVKEDASKAVELYKLAITAGYAPALYSLGSMHKLGTGVNRDTAEGSRLQEKALRMGYTPDVEDTLESSATSSSESKIAASGVSFRYKLLAKPVGIDYDNWASDANTLVTAIMQIANKNTAEITYPHMQQFNSNRTVYDESHLKNLSEHGSHFFATVEALFDQDKDLRLGFFELFRQADANSDGVLRGSEIFNLLNTFLPLCSKRELLYALEMMHLADRSKISETNFRSLVWKCKIAERCVLRGALQPGGTSLQPVERAISDLQAKLRSTTEGAEICKRCLTETELSLLLVKLLPDLDEKTFRAAISLGRVVCLAGESKQSGSGQGASLDALVSASIMHKNRSLSESAIDRLENVALQQIISKWREESDNAFEKVRQAPLKSEERFKRCVSVWKMRARNRMQKVVAEVLTEGGTEGDDEVVLLAKGDESIAVESASSDATPDPWINTTPEEAAAEKEEAAAEKPAAGDPEASTQADESKVKKVPTRLVRSKSLVEHTADATFNAFKVAAAVGVAGLTLLWWRSDKYVVYKGDTVYSLTRDHVMVQPGEPHYEELLRLNPHLSRRKGTIDKIFEGETIRLPRRQRVSTLLRMLKRRRDVIRHGTVDGEDNVDNVGASSQSNSDSRSRKEERGRNVAWWRAAWSLAR